MLGWISKFFVAVATVGVMMSSATMVMAQPAPWIEQTDGLLCVAGPDNDIATIRGLQCLLANTLTVVLSLFVLIGFVMVVYGAVMYMLSGGQPQRMEKAKDTITYVVIGLILAISSFVIINLIVYFTGVNALLSIDWNALSAPAP
jgi:hypothetical protein